MIWNTWCEELFVIIIDRQLHIKWKSKWYVVKSELQKTSTKSSSGQYPLYCHAISSGRWSERNCTLAHRSAQTLNSLHKLLSVFIHRLRILANLCRQPVALTHVSLTDNTSWKINYSLVWWSNYQLVNKADF